MLPLYTVSPLYSTPILFPSTVTSGLSKLADINLYTPVIEKDLRLGAISSRNASLELTDLIYYGVIKENIDQAKKDLTKTRELIHEVNNK